MSRSTQTFHLDLILPKQLLVLQRVLEREHHVFKAAQAKDRALDLFDFLGNIEIMTAPESLSEAPHSGHDLESIPDHFIGNIFS